MSVVEEEVQWKILTYYSYESYWVQLLIIMGEPLFSFRVAHFYLKYLKR